jgi:hypothetical protein
MEDIASQMNQQQRQETEAFTSTKLQNAILGDENTDIDSQIKLAEEEQDPLARDHMLRGIVIDLSRGNAERAFSVASRIKDADLRAQTEDDINLILLSAKLRSKSLEDGYRIAVKINDTNLRAKMLADLASGVLSDSKDAVRANELLSEAYVTASKGENTPDKLEALLIITNRFVTLDPMRAFETLSAAVKIANQLGDDSMTPAKPLRGVAVITVINGREVRTGVRLPLESIEFDKVGMLAKRDFTQIKLLGDKLQNKLLRGKFLVAMASAVLRSSQRTPS